MSNRGVQAAVLYNSRTESNCENCDKFEKCKNHGNCRMLQRCEGVESVAIQTPFRRISCGIHRLMSRARFSLSTKFILGTGSLHTRLSYDGHQCSSVSVRRADHRSVYASDAFSAN
ncbi:uncharacterized protein M421DRAFT_252873 [Didymella exigua CBS 183.55]|uniref:Uncharacterized protein n=1 Tax=Didymella exigua CBS 183.55 TaxID=1150837 RepID=A0A6A5S0W6_9PLEO|nr:uncharacterized protein M421DRAFT_252873 [Didymella exigua CBS 183.55]KAF1932928.1 hypothetical protein M421DRAFT_252873 [Didymella exigua CBS 183.55]